MRNESMQKLFADVTRQLLEKTRSAQVDADWSGAGYDKGRHFALCEVVSLLSEHAEALSIDRKSIGLTRVDPEWELLGAG